MIRCEECEMNTESKRSETVLSLMVQQYHQRHNRLPERIFVTPLALLCLTIKNSIRPVWEGIPVTCREVDEAEATVRNEDACSLAVCLMPMGSKGHLVACDLKS